MQTKFSPFKPNQVIDYMTPFLPSEPRLFAFPCLCFITDSDLMCLDPCLTSVSSPPAKFLKLSNSGSHITKPRPFLCPHLPWVFPFTAITPDRLVIAILNNIVQACHISTAHSPISAPDLAKVPVILCLRLQYNLHSVCYSIFRPKETQLITTVKHLMETVKSFTTNVQELTMYFLELYINLFFINQHV